jgi:hypothetical protein
MFENWTDPFDKRPELKKTDMRFGTRNVGSKYRAGWLMAAAKETIKILVRFRGSAGGGTEPAEDTFLYGTVDWLQVPCA